MNDQCALCGKVGGGRSGDLCWSCHDDLEPLKKQMFAMGMRPTSGALMEVVELMMEIRDLLKELVETGKRQRVTKDGT